MDVDPRRINVTTLTEMGEGQRSLNKNSSILELERQMSSQQHYARRMQEEIKKLRTANNTLVLELNSIERRLPKFHGQEIMAAQKNNQRMEQRRRNIESGWERVPHTRYEMVRKGTSPGVPG